MSFYVVRNWHRKWAFVHLGSCGHCNHAGESSPRTADKMANGALHSLIGQRQSRSCKRSVPLTARSAGFANHSPAWWTLPLVLAARIP